MIPHNSRRGVRWLWAPAAPLRGPDPHNYKADDKTPALTHRAGVEFVRPVAAGSDREE